MSCPYHNLFNLHPLYLSEFSYELWVSASAATSTSTSSQTREAGSGDGGWGKTKPETYRQSNPHNNREANRMLPISQNANHMHFNILALRIANPFVYRSRLTINHQECTNQPKLYIKHFEQQAQLRNSTS